MRWRVLAYVSLGVNLVLAIVWLVVAGKSAKNRSTEGGAGDSASRGSTNIVVRRQFFSWQEVESSDYPTFIANLRSINCPEQTIRDIIIADVNGLYARKRATELVTSEQQWWRSEPDSNVVATASAKARLLDDERRALLARLLGPNWEAGDMTSLPRPSQPGVVLDGAILGVLPAETKQAVQEVNLRSQERLESYLASQRVDGKDPDPVEVAKLRQQTRTDLQRILTPPQLEEYLLRYSQNASNLRADFGQLRFFNPTQDEFRNVFRATDNLDQQIQLLADSTDSNSVAQRKALEDQRENAIKVALGTKRYEEYRLLQDPIYREAVALAQAAGTPDAARSIYAVNLTAASEQQRIQADPDLTPEQKAIKLKELELQQLQANTAATGGDLPPEPAPTAPPRRTHVVRPGDSAAVLALVYGVPVSAIRAANPRVDLSRLQAGQTLNIPPTLLPNSLP
ncbi:MAG TPA: LysM domain-containing protein [Candidatus Eisenbacteria bacterium]|nr:LysM domain-containing protein [Candidatus Eisenbacteria bacterium]